MEEQNSLLARVVGFFLTRKLVAALMLAGLGGVGSCGRSLCLGVGLAAARPRARRCDPRHR